MCRFMVYKGSDEILLSKLILDPTHSILTQSFDSRLRLDMRRPHNGDGFGIGYYTDPKLGPEPCIFTSTTPAWNCVNLQRIASKTASHLIFAHVRATTEGSLSDDNCHPFCHGSLMWMHNGGLGGWKQIKRKLGQRLADKWYLGVQGGTDSEWAFALFLDTLERMGYDPSMPPAAGFGPTVIRQAMLKAIKQINDFIAEIPEDVVRDEKVDTRSLLNFAVTDGHSVVCSRYVSSRTDEAASLYYSSGTTWEDKSSKGEYQMDRRDKGADIVLVASEPLTFERESWVTVPTNSILTIHKQTVMVHPIIDEYYNYNPYHSRSSQYVQDKGLVSNEKGLNGIASPAATPSLLNGRKSALSASLHENIANTFLPSMHSRSASPALSPANEVIPRFNPPPSDLRHLTSVHNLPVQEPRTVEQGNTKKKRASIVVQDQANPQPQPQQEPPIPDSPPRRTYGDPNKIAQYFPELN
ncbi:related to glucosamine 6-phosphate synthetases, contain amidotransferase and phosphosugar isomerase domains [Phialocephala subalpina]|uniref:Related to glucosamine 6-phosphate synthetases, contain amidotransferase and phosphosugar isomerase domains n=1 Tax=Phialocephala subalpina TaxID=576137 RepID=A0A1L7XJB7_9HELO|nr:related to glucosamine 6-phosphate synthetases, contain amidotransferase and phosphosugar isomerase domains [Phialocephala subalpina]